MDLLKILVYLVALIIIIAIAYNIVAEVLEQRYTPIPVEHIAGLGKPKRIECPSNSSDADVYRIDFLKVLGGIDYDYIFNANLSGFNITKYLIEYAKLSLAVPISYYAEDVAVYELHMLPVSENDEENLTAKGIYLCLPPAVFTPTFVVVNRTDRPTTISVNFATPPPYAELYISVSSAVANYTTVLGAVEVRGHGYQEVGEEVGGTYCATDTSTNATRCDTHVYKVYSVWIGYRASILVNGRSITVFDGVRRFAFTASGGRAVEWVHGYYAGFGPFAKVVADIRTSLREDCAFDVNASTMYCNITHYISGMSVYTHTRGLRIPTVSVGITASSIALTGVEPVNVSIGRAHPLNHLSPVTRVPVVFTDSIDVCGYLFINGTPIPRCLFHPFRRVRTSFAGYLELRYVIKDFEWRWGEVVDLPYEIAVEKKFYPPPYAPDIDLNKLFYGYLQEAVLRHVASIIDGYASRTGYRDFEAWALSTQVAIQMDVCDSHSHSHMPLLEALQSGCGSDIEKAEVLSKLLSHLGIENSVNRFTVYTSRKMEVVCAEAWGVAALISSYPPFYELERDGCAYAVNWDGRRMYLVAYDTVQNNVFSILDRITSGL